MGNDPPEKAEAKSFVRPSLTVARDKLLADLVEKEVEDDVFSSELEDLLERERGSDVFRMSLYGEPLDPICADITILDESGRLATIAEDPLSGKSSQIRKKAEFNFIKSAESIHESPSQDHEDGITEKNDEEDASGPVAGEFVDEHQAILQDAEDLRTASTVESVTANETSDGDCNTSTEVNEDLNAAPASPVQEITENKPSEVVGDLKKAKALALIEKFKAEAAAKKASPVGECDQKKDDRVRERARRLIEQTRESLDIAPSKYSISVENLDQGSTNGHLQSTESPNKYATLPAKHILQTSDLEKSSLSKNLTTSPTLSYPDGIDEKSRTCDNQYPESAESCEVLPELGKTCQSSSEEKTFVETTNIKSDLPISERQHDTTTISVFNQNVDIKNNFSKYPTDSGLSTSENYIKTSEPCSARRLEDFKSESAINHIQFTPISPTVVPNIKTFSDILDEAKKSQASSIAMSPTHDGNPFETNDQIEVDSIETSPTDEHNPFETSDPDEIDSGDAAVEKEELICRRDSDFNENMWERVGKKPNTNSRYVVVDSFDGVGGGDMTDSSLPAHKTMDVSVNRADTDFKSSSNQEHWTESVEVSTNDFQHSSVSVITVGGVSSSNETATGNAPVVSNANVSGGVGREESNIHSHSFQEVTSPSPSIAKSDPVPSQGVKDSNSFTSPTHAQLKQEKPSDRSKPTTSTPRHDLPPARLCHTRNVMSQDESKVETTGDQNKTQLQFNVVKPVKMTSLESFSPIILSTKEQLADELPRSRPNSFVLSTTLSTALKNEKAELDKEGAELEEEMRTVDNVTANLHKELQELRSMKRGKNSEREEILMQEYFRLVQSKNAIVKKQDSHTLKLQQHELSKQMEEINEQLRPFLNTEESLKTEADKEEEKTLLENLVCLVEERNRLEQQIDENEQMALEEDMHVQTNLNQNMSTVFDKEQEKCAIM